jgi:hypothetical protein
MPKAKEGWKPLSILVFFLSIVIPFWFLPRDSGSLWLFCFSLAFLAYLHLCFQVPDRWSRDLGIFTRLALFAGMPVLSDDVYRFIWDGYILQSGLNPYAATPESYVDTGVPGLTNDLFAQLNSPQYYSVYPPLNQYIFWLSTLFSGHLLVQTGVMRLFLLASDFMVYRLLLRMHSERAAHLYFLNPLIILEGVGNVHFEVMVAAFLMLGLSYWNDKRKMAALSLAMAVGVKLLPFIFTPYFVFQSWRQKDGSFSIILALGIILILGPAVSWAWEGGTLESLGLYFRNFEFNASFYYLARDAIASLIHYNAIQWMGPVISALTLVLILLFTLWGIVQKMPAARVMCLVLTVYLLMATTVHPWYVIPLIPLGILSGFAYPIH